MALCQLIFDISFTRHITSDSSYVSSAGNFTTALWNGLQFFGGLSVSIWTNILAIVVLKVVVTFEAFNIRKNFYFLSAVAMLPPFIICILSMALYKEDATSGDQDVVGTVYSYSRAVSIAINFVCYGIIAVRARKITTATAGEISSQQLLINELSRRMIYYPLMQTVSRIGACVYEPVYGYGPYLGHSSQPEFSWACVYAITAPAAGIGYLVIFLLMQPYAYEQFVSLLTTCKPIPSTGTSVASSQDRRKYSDNSLSDHTNSHKTTSSNGFSDSLARGGSMHSLSRGSTKGNGEARTDSTIQFMDDDELIKAIKVCAMYSTCIYLCNLYVLRSALYARMLHAANTGMTYCFSW